MTNSRAEGLDARRRAEFEAAGLLEGLSVEDRQRRLRAIELLVEWGATIDDLVENRDDLGLIAARLINRGRPTMTRQELADRCGMPLDVVQRLWLAAGLVDPGPDVVSASEADIILFETFKGASAILGEDAAFQLARVVGAATGKMADAIASAYRATLASQAVFDDVSGLDLVEANIALGQLMAPFMATIEQLLRAHMITFIRPVSTLAPVTYDSRTVAVGFVDLVGSTELAARLPTAELSTVLTEFESTAADIVVRGGGRVVKLIGDEIMFTATAPLAAGAVAEQLVAAVEHHPILPPARAGIAYGEVLTRDGDYFGPVVNLAARLVAAASPGQVVVDEAMANALANAAGGDEWQVESLGALQLKGFSEMVPALSLRRSSLQRP